MGPAPTPAAAVPGLRLSRHAGGECSSRVRFPVVRFSSGSRRQSFWEDIVSWRRSPTTTTPTLIPAAVLLLLRPSVPPRRGFDVWPRFTKHNRIRIGLRICSRCRNTTTPYSHGRPNRFVNYWPVLHWPTNFVTPLTPVRCLSSGTKLKCVHFWSVAISYLRKHPRTTRPKWSNSSKHSKRYRRGASMPVTTTTRCLRPWWTMTTTVRHRPVGPSRHHNNPLPLLRTTWVHILCLSWTC